MYPENPEGTRVIVGSMNMRYDIYLSLQSPSTDRVMFRFTLSLINFRYNPWKLNWQTTHPGYKANQNPNTKQSS